MAKEKKRAFGTSGVSTSMQVESGYSLDDQENKIKEYAKKEGYTLVDVFRDEGKSDKNISDRSQFKHVLEHIQGGEKVDYVLDYPSFTIRT